jgi:hypothetical protein
MRNQSTERKMYHSLFRKHGSENYVLTMDELRRSNQMHALSVMEAKEEDFLLGKTPELMPDNWEDDE